MLSRLNTSGEMASMAFSWFLWVGRYRSEPRDVVRKEATRLNFVYDGKPGHLAFAPSRVEGAKLVHPFD